MDPEGYPCDLRKVRPGASAPYIEDALVRRTRTDILKGRKIIKSADYAWIFFIRR